MVSAMIVLALGPEMAPRSAVLERGHTAPNERENAAMRRPDTGGIPCRNRPQEKWSVVEKSCHPGGLPDESNCLKILLAPIRLYRSLPCFKCAENQQLADYRRALAPRLLGQREDAVRHPFLPRPARRRIA